MEAVKDYLRMLGREIINAIQGSDGLEQADEIAEMSEDYNEIYKFMCHHEHVVYGMDPRDTQEPHHGVGSK